MGYCGGEGYCNLFTRNCLGISSAESLYAKIVPLYNFMEKVAVLIRDINEPLN